MKRTVMGLAALAAAAGFADDTWKGPVGVEAGWNVGSNWTSGIVPDAEIAYVDNGGYAVMSSGTVFNNGTVALSQGANMCTVRIEPGATLTNTKVLVANTGFKRQLLLIDGGSIQTGTKDFVLAQNEATSTGVVVMAGGEVTARNLFVGYNGSGFFTLSNGLFRTVVEGIVGRSRFGSYLQEGGTNSFDNGADLYLARFSSSRGEYTLNGGALIVSDFSYLGYDSQAEGVLTVNGGTLITSNNVVVGAAQGGRGVMTVNGGNRNWQALGSVLRVGYATSASGSLTLNGHTNSLKAVNVGDLSGSTGRVFLTGSDITISNGLALAGAVGSVVQSGGKLAVAAGGLTVGGTVTGSFIASNGATFSANSVTVSATGAMGLRETAASVPSVTVSGSLTAGENTTLTADSATVNSTGTLMLQGAAVTVTNAAASATMTVAYGGQVELDGGSLTLDKLSLSTGATKSGPPSFRMTDGLFVSKTNTTLNGGAPFVQTGGVISNSEYYVYGSSNNVGRFEISGGRFVVTPLNYALFNSGTSEFRLKGSAPQVYLNRFSYVGGQPKSFLLAFVLDKSPAHLAPVNFTGSDGYRCGHLRVALDGGAVLARTNVFALLTGVKTTGFNYLSTPDVGMWTETLANQTSRVTLASGYKKGTLGMGGMVTAGPFDPAPMGHVEVSNLSTYRLVELNVRLAVQAGAKTVDEVVADMVAAGYTNSVAEAEGGYNVKLVIPAEDVADRSAAPVSYFAWDFTRTPSVTNVAAVVTNATVTAVKLEYTKLPSLGTMLRVF